MAPVYSHRFLKLFLLTFMLGSTAVSAYAQSRSTQGDNGPEQSLQPFTPYDDLPGMIKSYKPPYFDHYPEWAKALYHYPVNYNAVCTEFDRWFPDAERRARDSGLLPQSTEDGTQSLEPGQGSPEESPLKSPIIRYFKTWRRIVEPYALTDGTIRLPDLVLAGENLKSAQLAAGARLAANRSATDRLKAAPSAAGVYNEPIRADDTDIKSARQTAATQLKSASGDNAWSFLGPKETHFLYNPSYPDQVGACPWQVNVYAFDVAATDPSVLYCGTETGFVSKSLDKGLSWQQLGLTYPFGGGVTAVAIHPLDYNIVYASAGNQIHKTTDGGQSWTPLLSSTTFQADRLKIDPRNPEKIIAAATSGVFISTDSGQSWSKRWHEATWDVDIKPDDPQIIYAITTTSAGYFSVVMSTDGGATFSAKAGFPTTIKNNGGALIAVTPANPGLLYAVLLTPDGTDNNIPYIYKGVYANNAFTWTRAATGKTTQLGMDNGQGYFDLILEIDPNNAQMIFAGTTTLYKSVNGGTNWSPVGGYAGNFPIHPDIQDMKILPNGEMWTATDGGMNLTTDRFVTRSNHVARNAGLIGSDMWGFDQGWNEDLVVGGRYHNGNTAITEFYGGTALRMGGAESPTGWVLKGKSRHVAFDDLGNGFILPRNVQDPAEGRFVFSKFPNMEEYGGRRGNLLHHPNYYSILYLGEGNGFWKSGDMGVTFDLLYTFPDKVRYIQMSYSNPDVIYADVVNQGLYRSGDGGKTWSQKPALTGSGYAGTYWKGKLFFDVSPYNPDRIYAVLQNGTWSNDLGRVYRSSDGGTTWEDWTGSIHDYLKCLVIQPTVSGEERVYLFTTSRNGSVAKVFHRGASETAWSPYDINYPAGMQVNIALPFYRDSKIRVAGNAGIWEVPFAEEAFTPIVNPWTDRPVNNCMEDTLTFDDHSILNHAGAEWEWVFSPEPVYISSTKVRNPKVVLGNPGSYSVTLKVAQNGQTYSKTVADMVRTVTCPSLSTCDNPAQVPVSSWSLLYADSEEINEPGLARMAFDGDPCHDLAHPLEHRQ